MIEAELEEIRRGGVAGDVTTQLGGDVDRAHHHRESVPAHQGDQPLLGLQRARKRRLPGQRDGVAGGGAPDWRQRYT
ncbi:hypothetical protein [uncultured Thiodictyon sp.]|uniref:hypothetical protein n=1 Tax=uncultured Thiodictyon sp. TaxID=1846217 RepID=UPI0025E79A8D|nr:hypothetical protein [uncultured Thiodictyon sp.]